MAEFLAWKQNHSRYFGDGDGAVEKLRRPWPSNAPFNLVETSYFGFNIPEHDIDCEIYHWIHPVLGVASGGILCFKGMRKSAMEAEYVQYLNYMPIPDDITDCTYANGITVKMIEPLKSFRISYSDPRSETSLDLHTTAIMPPAFRPAGGHYTQGMKNSGVLVLRGREYAIDGYFSRDRSWGDPRNEGALDIPPVGWHVVVFSESLAFHVIAFDSEDLPPDFAKRYPTFDKRSNLLWGYVWSEGRLLGIKQCRKRTLRCDDGIYPRSVELQIVDEEDRSYLLSGEVRSQYPFAIWPNSMVSYSLTRWTHDGLTGFGDTQESYYNDFVRSRTKPARG